MYHGNCRSLFLLPFLQSTIYRSLRLLGCLVRLQPMEMIWLQYWRLLRKSAKLILVSFQPLTLVWVVYPLVVSSRPMEILLNMRSVFFWSPRRLWAQLWVQYIRGCCYWWPLHDEPPLSVKFRGARFSSGARHAAPRDFHWWKLWSKALSLLKFESQVHSPSRLPNNLLKHCPNGLSLEKSR